MTPEEVRGAIEAGAVVLDMRPPKPFSDKHVAGAVNMQFNRADLADRAELMLPTDVLYIVHAEPEPIAKIAMDILSDAGFKVEGHLEGGIKAWEEAGGATASLPVIDVDELHSNPDAYHVIDSREGFEYRHAHIAGAVSMSAFEIFDEAGKAPSDKPLAIVCGDQVRSTLVASVLIRHGRDARLVWGGMVDWLDRKYPVEAGA